ncbi:thiol-disulfide isomerase [bacterium (Candidatus Blackallbacteria) CG17_big_fil_post_rev_8_21_14_2_50_48_46]|uniref:Thiol-disulfide isomerase n=1 Tax=bacterium (Candidatus Blackallbacteria) CG17_big_fil_post_rev_8_21_14_2_50_48_46 TaxID=2014261 RepID=A0A2M7G1S7_9BACT|nr:MAG: thiol-disulfide isomerase [bacterium (Candidatus Blackallbacteria) CG18_big_fil_WC_8_21_14_2_50_49_26]PIW15290.1 MAG: thiol-disulfide isomerase [bacterium (Candidatus Blackallbacteria) CG17_big_fil_post_rev_8_21_14_2_50_48_46]PIW45201.1 MAG: thiol-disulfide isomerase [bacterium (Candidatus Blackallbacteria) CG13_big_fil_rev_8_21_14_2_50_49_14]
MFKPVILSLFALLLSAGSLTLPAMAEKAPASQTQTQPAKAQVKPIVAVVKADWCPACQKISPTLMGLMKDYMNKADWVVLDVTNPKTTAEAEKKAKQLGLEKFYAEFGAKTSTVAIIDPQTKKVLKMFMAEGKREKYVLALNQALAAHQE